MVSQRLAYLVLIGFLFLFEGPNYSCAVQKEEVIDQVSLTVTEVGKGLRSEHGGRKMALIMGKQRNSQTTGNDENVSKEEWDEGISEAIIFDFDEECSSKSNSNYKDGSKLRLLEEDMEIVSNDDYGVRNKGKRKRKPPIHN